MSKVENGNPSQQLTNKTFNETYKSVTEGEVIGKLIAVVDETTDAETDAYKMGNVTLKCEDGLHMYVANQVKIREIRTLQAQMLATRSQPKITLYVVPIVLKSGEGVRGRIAGFSPEFD